MAQLAPGGLLVNFTNPSGLVTEALYRYAPQVASVGVCNAAIGVKMDIMKRLEKLLGKKVDASHTELKTLGLNHLSWYRGFTLDGEDLWPQIITAYIEELKCELEPEWDAHLIESLQMIPNGYLQYYYETGHKITAQEKWPPSRAEEVMEVEKNLLREYADPALTAPPADLLKRGGAYYSTVATQLLNAHYNNLGETHIVNTRHGGAVKGWPEDWVLEIACRVDRAGIHPLPSEPLPAVCAGLLAQVKAYELLTVEAAVHGDRNAAYQALLAHPLGPSSGQVQTVLDDMLATHRDYLPQFFTGVSG
jgi:6-phospho-beta-glucosidase